MIFMDQTHEKYEKLKDYLQDLGSVAVAFSSGVDSTFLLKTAVDVLGDKVLAITASSCSFPKRELEEAKTFCAEHGIRHMVVESEELEIEGFRSNPMNRCSPFSANGILVQLIRQRRSSIYSSSK